MHTTDPFTTDLGGSAGEEFPNTKRNLLDVLNSAGAEQTRLQVWGGRGTVIKVVPGEPHHPLGLKDLQELR